ncbi:hypothetical protein Shyhy02_30560 [Streptomyces hygroscopicus subsp. hygroscopicus]|nr:hypothetical protein Shyhy02_30560 [Streptomyces hygroscopicus subsp. hygroscopicus]
MAGTASADIPLWPGLLQRTYGCGRDRCGRDRLAGTAAAEAAGPGTAATETAGSGPLNRPVVAGAPGPDAPDRTGYGRDRFSGRTAMAGTASADVPLWQGPPGRDRCDRNRPVGTRNRPVAVGPTAADVAPRQRPLDRTRYRPDALRPGPLPPGPAPASA